MKRPILSTCMAALALSGPLSWAAGEPADLVLRGAKIYTADDKRSMAQALAVRAGRIVFVGTNEGAQAYIGPDTRTEDAAGKLVLPGLFDSHVHATNIVDLDVCDLKSQTKSLAEIATLVRGCIEHYHIADGEWVIVRQWNFSNGNTPDAKYPTLRATLDAVSTRHPVQLLGNDGHHGAFNSVALARAKAPAGAIIGFSRATLNGPLHEYKHLIGVDAAGEPNGTVNEQARQLMSVPSMMEVDFVQVMKDPSRVAKRLNSVGITGILDPAVRPAMYALYDALDKSGELTLRANLAQFYDPEVLKTPAGQSDWDGMLSSAKTVRSKYAGNPLIKANYVKLFADGVLEGNPYAVPPTPPEVAGIKPYLQPIFKAAKDGKLEVTGYVNTAAPYCAEAREHPDKYESGVGLDQFMQQHGHHPAQCVVPVGKLQHEPAVIMEFVKRFHVAGFNVHIHAIGDLPIRTAVDAIEAARKADGISSTHDALAHVQVVNPADIARIGRDHLYLAFTYSWAFADPEYDLSVVPYFDRVHGGEEAALHPANGYYERNAYPVKSLQQAGATLIAGSDAPVNTRDPQPFVNMAFAVTRRLPGHKVALNPKEAISIRDVLDAYTRSGAAYLELDKETGSLEVGKSADLIVVDQDILALADGGHAEQVASTRVLKTFFMGKQVFPRQSPR